MSEWISVKDRLPKKNGRYMVVTRPCLNSVSARYCEILSFAKCLEKIDEYDFNGKKSQGFYDYDSEWGYYEHHDVTHWMPLPEMPKE